MDELQNDNLEQTGVEQTTENLGGSTAPDPKFQELEAKKKYWREKAVDPATGKTYKALYEESQKSSPATADPSKFATKEDLQRIELSNLGHDAETVSSIMAFAKGVGKDPIAVLEDPFVKSAVEAKKAKTQLESAIPSSSSRSAPIPLSKPYREMSYAEKQEHFEKTRAKYVK